MMNIPTREECLKMLRDEGTPDNIIEHTLQVTRVAVFIANRLREKGIGVDARLVESGALLHDVKKWDEIVNKRHASHGEAGMLLLKERYPEVASLVKKHMLYEILDGGLTTWEEKIINYADKRVNNNKIVTLKERFEYLNQRYPPKDIALRDKVKALFFALEKELFSPLGIDPDRIADHLG